MRKIIREILQNLNNDFGNENPSIFANPKRFKAELDDVMIKEDEKKIRHILNVAIRDIQAYSRLEADISSNVFIMNNLTAEMSSVYMIEEKTARMVLECIAELLGFGPFEGSDGNYTVPAAFTGPSPEKILSDFGQDQLKTGREYYQQLDFANAQHHLLLAAERGNAEAACAMGDIFADARNPRHDVRRSLEWYEKAAASGHSRAQWLAGVGYLAGTGCEKDLDKAKYWLQQSADQYDKDGQYALAGYYSAIEDFDSAIPWLKRAAVKGHMGAMGILYEMGLT